MNASPVKLVSLVIFPVLAQTSFCNPANILRDIFNPDVVLVGEGTLEASGTGTATLRGNGTIRVTTTDRTGLVIFNASDVAYELDGEGQTYWYQGHLIVDGLKGTASIEGEDLRVGLHGGPMELFAEGQGRVTLSGEGTYSTNGGQAVGWPADEQPVQYASGVGEPDVADIPDADIEASHNYDELIQRVRDRLDNPDVSIGGTGTLDAEGSGSASITGSATVEIKAQGRSGLVIFDADQVDFELTGDGRTQWRGNDLVAEGLTGSAYIRGEDLRVVVTGGPMTLHVEGTGRVRLSGSGSYEVNGEPPVDIPEEETDVSF